MPLCWPPLSSSSVPLISCCWIMWCYVNRCKQRYHVLLKFWRGLFVVDVWWRICLEPTEACLSCSLALSQQSAAVCCRLVLHSTVSAAISSLLITNFSSETFSLVSASTHATRTVVGHQCISNIQYPPYSGCSGVAAEHRTCNREVVGSTHTRSTASNLEQVANLLCAQANSAYVYKASMVKFGGDLILTTTTYRSMVRTY